MVVCLTRSTLVYLLYGYYLPVYGQVLPVNRYFSAEAELPQPDLECLVGVHSASTSELYRVRCTQAWNISVQYDRKTANSFASANYISEHDRRLRTIKFGIQGSGLKYNAWSYWSNWTHPVSTMVIYDCIPENHAPSWWKIPLLGPAFPTG